MKLLDDIQAIKDVQKIKAGGTAKLSVSAITNLIVNLSDASKVLSQSDYEKVFAIYCGLREYTTKIPMDMKGYFKVASDILLRFDNAVPCESYLGLNSFEASVLMRLIRANPKNDDSDDESTDFSDDVTDTGDTVSDDSSSDTISDSDTSPSSSSHTSDTSTPSGSGVADDSSIDSFRTSRNTIPIYKNKGY